MYVLIRKDLPRSYAAVQAGHAVAEYLLRGPKDHNWKNGTLIYLEVKNEKQLIEYCNILEKKGIHYSGFREPDIGNQLTAISVVAEKGQFEELQLL